MVEVAYMDVWIANMGAVFMGPMYVHGSTVGDDSEHESMKEGMILTRGVRMVRVE